MRKSNRKKFSSLIFQAVSTNRTKKWLRWWTSWNSNRKFSIIKRKSSQNSKSASRINLYKLLISKWKWKSSNKQNQISKIHVLLKLSTKLTTRSPNLSSLVKRREKISLKKGKPCISLGLKTTATEREVISILFSVMNWNLLMTSKDRLWASIWFLLKAKKLRWFKYLILLTYVAWDSWTKTLLFCLRLDKQLLVRSSTSC